MLQDAGPTRFESGSTPTFSTLPNSALILVTARLKCIAEHEWDKRKYLDMLKLEEMDELKGKAEG